jgi:hypothetical protein
MGVLHPIYLHLLGYGCPDGLTWIANETGLQVNILEAGHIFSPGPFLEVFNGAKIFGHLSDFGYIWGLDRDYPPHLGAPGGIRTHNRLIRRSGIPPIVMAGVTPPA